MTLLEAGHLDGGNIVNGAGSDYNMYQQEELY
jgi:hypothetical protein